MTTRVFLAMGLIVAATAGCGDNTTVTDDEPFVDNFCPGPGCEPVDGAVLRAGAARVVITPTLTETEWTDEDEDSHWSKNEPFVDTNGNGEFDAYWIAGSSNGRVATDVHDDIFVKAIVLEHGNTRLAIAVVDAIGWFSNDIDASRELLDPALEIDHMIVTSLHIHEVPDTMGLWGEAELASGIKPEYQRKIQQATADAVAAAVGNLEDVTMTVAQKLAVDDNGSCLPYVGDVRDPAILDPTVSVIQFAAVGEARNVATLVHWAAHPEYIGFDNNSISADYIYWLREGVENGVPEHTALGLPAVEGVGGEVIYINGALGGQVGPSAARPYGFDGTPLGGHSWEKAEVTGNAVARVALEAITSSELARDVADPDIAFRTAPIALTVENTFYHVAGLVGVFDRPFTGYDETKAIGPGNYPYIDSRVTYVQLGNVGIITAPGELLPELFVGGYDGSSSYGMDIIDPDNENPPNLATAPEGPYLRDYLLMNEDVEVPLVFGLAEDMIGYIVPSYNYQLDPNGPYISEAKGDHYEETNSVGPLVEEEVVGAMRDLIQFSPTVE